jgi:DNA-binding LytR/AlgR family response regulator
MFNLDGYEVQAGNTFLEQNEAAKFSRSKFYYFGKALSSNSSLFDKNIMKPILINGFVPTGIKLELNVIDYLLKPIEFSRFLKAVNKMEQTKEIVIPASPIAQPAERVYLFFNVGKKKVKVFLDEILYIESIKEYIRVNTKSKSVLTKFKLSQVNGLLNENNFLRIHRSYIVAKDKIEAFSASEVELGGKQLPIGRSYKESVLSVL